MTPKSWHEMTDARWFAIFSPHGRRCMPQLQAGMTGTRLPQFGSKEFLSKSMTKFFSTIAVSECNRDVPSSFLYGRAALEER